MLKEPNDCGKADQRGWFNAGGVLLSTSHGTLHRSLQDFNRFAHLICSFAQKEYLLFLGSEKGSTARYFSGFATNRELNIFNEQKPGYRVVKSTGLFRGQRAAVRLILSHNVGDGTNKDHSSEGREKCPEKIEEATKNSKNGLDRSRHS